MSVGNSMRKIAAEVNVGLRICKLMARLRTVPENSTAAVLGVSKYKDIPQFAVGKTQIENFNFVFPKLDINTKKNIIEPEKSIKINFELPIRKKGNTELELPFQIKKEITEPVGRVIHKEAHRMIRIRKRKMRKHKRKKFIKKHKAELFKRALARKMEKEANFQTELRNILQEKENFSAENYVNDLISKSNWVPPVNKVRGRLAPQWVIKEYLEKKEENRIIRNRIKECLARK